MTETDNHKQGQQRSCRFVTLLFVLLFTTFLFRKNLRLLQEHIQKKRKPSISQPGSAQPQKHYG